MGMWDEKPWGNDAAADWFAGLFESTFLHHRVAETLEAEVDEHSFEEIRAGSTIVLMLGRDCVWPPDELDRVLELARARLREACQPEVVREAAGLAGIIEGEVVILESRMGEARFRAPGDAWMRLS